MRKFYLLFIALIFLFLSTRLYKITEIPGSLYWDEASIGYNAYSILQTGSDEWGSFLPLHFRAFGEFKLPVYIYSVAAAGLVFGINDFTVRLPALIFSLGIMILTILLTIKLTGQKSIALLSAFFLITSPWFFIFSRTGFEVTAGLMFYLLGIYLFLLSGKKPIWVVVSMLSFVLSIYSYNSYRILAPLTIAFLFFYRYWMGYLKLFNATVWLIVSSLIIGIGAIPIIRLTLFDHGANRLQAVSITSQAHSIPELVVTFIGNYFSHFNPIFLFWSGDSNVRLQLPGFGQLFIVAIPFILLGLWWVVENFSEKQVFLLVFLLAIAPIPAAITFEAPHALRAFTMIPILSIIMAGGVWQLTKIVKTNRIIIPITVVFLGFFGWYYFQFITNYNLASSAAWQYPYSQIFTKDQALFADYDKVIVSDADAQPYIFALYYLKYNPQQFLTTVSYNSVDKFGFSTVHSFGKFIFEPVAEENLPKGKLLVFTSPKEQFNNGSILGTIKNTDGSIAFNIFEYQK